jgi:predicted transcriptional regulator
MAPLPAKRPNQLSLGPLETEILAILWSQGAATVRAIHNHILADPNRDLAQASVTTVLQRLAKKGWVTRQATRQSASGKPRRVYLWQPTISQQEAEMVMAHQQLQDFLAIGTPDLVAAFADSLDKADVDKLDAIAHRLRLLRQAREEGD